ncbi:MAG: hypothetical protein ACI81R_000497 [Bradymonadia bacterium]|jgi:hypothetical protein
MKIVFLALAFVVMASGVAEARDDQSQRALLEELNALLTQLERHDLADDAATEFGQARLEVADAQAKITAQDSARADIVLIRLESRLMLAQSILERATIEQLSDQRETELFDMMTEADGVQIELESEQAQRQQLQDEVTAIINQMEADQ